jgi:hypothetical protein
VSGWCRLAAFFLVVGTVVCPLRASAATGVQLETHVRGIELADHAFVGGASARSPEKHLGNSLAYDEIAPGYSLATGALVARAEEVHSALDPFAQSLRTTAVLDTSAGRIVAGGGVDLTAAQRGLLEVGELYNMAPGLHAEVTAILGGQQIGARLQAIGTTRDLCPSCIDFIEGSGGVIIGPRAAVWPQ